MLSSIRPVCSHQAPLPWSPLIFKARQYWEIRPGTITLPERQARYWVDVARAFDQWGKPTACYAALRAAETAAPEETATAKGPRTRSPASHSAHHPRHERTTRIRRPHRRDVKICPAIATRLCQPFPGLVARHGDLHLPGTVERGLLETFAKDAL
jgi:hypothetical protein